MKIALVHDYLAQDGGAERVLRALHRLWPEAPIFTLFHQHGAVEGLDQADIRESYVARMPFGRTKYQWYLPIMPQAFESFDLQDFDIVISSTSAFAKGILTSPESVHICYCHTPTRYLWTDTHEYISDLRYGPLIKLALPRLIHRLRTVDRASADRVDMFVANSDTVARRIAKYYRQSSEIIFPPVDIVSSRKIKVQEVGDYFVSGGRLVPYKRFDIIVEAFNRLGKPLKIFGDGPEYVSLKRQARENITFVGRIADAEKMSLMAHAQAFIHPQLEDFGITPVESMAVGRPVIGYGKGGITETVIPEVTGILFARQSWDMLYEAVREFEKKTWDTDRIKAHATQFSEEIFATRMQDIVSRAHTTRHTRTYIQS